MPEVASKIESTSTELEVSNSQFVQRRVDYFQLLVQLAPKVSKKVRLCGAELISYIQNWNGWKKENYREAWFYQPLQKIYNDLMGAYSIHTIRETIALLVKLGILLVNKNNRSVNNRNGQDKVHCYLINSNRLKRLLTSLAPQSKKSQPANTETAETPSIKSKTRRVKIRTRRFTAEKCTKILSIDPSKKYSLLEEREELNFVQEEELEDPWTVDENEVVQEVLASFSNTQEILQEQNSSEGQFSAAPEPKCSEVVQPELKPLPKLECSEVVQPELKPLPKLKSDRPSGFRSDTERDGFYQELLELGRTQGKNSPVAWASAILKSINAGEPCQYLTEYREGQQVGSSEKQEWEIAPGQPHNQFLTYLKTRIKKAEMTDEQAIVTAHQQLKNVNLARSLWESFKRCIVNRRDDWEQQKQLGVQNAYLPSELLPEREVSLEQAAGAIASLQTGCAQLPAVEPAKLEPVKEEPIDPELELANLAALQQELSSASRLQASLIRMKAQKMGYRIEEGLVLPAEGMPSVEYLASLMTNPINARKVERLIAAHPEWGFWIDKDGEIQDF